MQTFLCKAFQHEQNHWCWTKNPLCALSLDSFYSECKFQICVQVFFNLWLSHTTLFVSTSKELSTSGPSLTMYDNNIYLISTQFWVLDTRFRSSIKNIVRMTCDTEKNACEMQLQNSWLLGTSCGTQFVALSLIDFVLELPFMNGCIWHFEHFGGGAAPDKTVCGEPCINWSRLRPKTTQSLGNCFNSPGM